MLYLTSSARHLVVDDHVDGATDLGGDGRIVVGSPRPYTKRQHAGGGSPVPEGPRPQIMSTWPKAV